MSARCLWNFLTDPPSAAHIQLSSIDSRMSFFQICAGDHRSEATCRLTYIPPVIKPNGLLVGLACSSAIATAATRWENTLVGYVVGERPSLGRLRACIQQLWKLPVDASVFPQDNDFFFFKLPNPKIAIGFSSGVRGYLRDVPLLFDVGGWAWVWIETYCLRYQCGCDFQSFRLIFGLRIF